MAMLSLGEPGLGVPGLGVPGLDVCSSAIGSVCVSIGGSVLR